MEKLKLADIRRITPNPVEGLTGFDPDVDEGIFGAAKRVIVAMVLRRGNEAIRHIDGDPKHPSARQHLADAADTSNWLHNAGDWDPNKQEPPKQLEPPKKKKRR